MLRKISVIAYGAVAYLGFVAALLYAIGFLAGVGVPKGVDDGLGGTVGPAWRALLVDGALLTVFAVQHSVMARPWFKRWWTRFVPASVERSTYVVASTAVLVLLLWQWQPLPATVWHVGPAWARGTLWALYLLGWTTLVFSTFAVGHFDLFGLRQVLDRARDRRYAEPEFREPPVYRLVRNPMMIGFLIAFWAAPDMSVGRLVFVLASTGYIMVGVRLEEHDLKRQLGEPYEEYLQRVPRFVPRPVR
jgi:protein-S-isoprenylcysteine O-methyltransferase Ste14